jgi:hypothetical protein
MFHFSFSSVTSAPVPHKYSHGDELKKKKKKKKNFFSNSQKAWLTLYMKVDGLYYFVPQYCSDLYLKAFNQ